MVQPGEVSPFLVDRDQEVRGHLAQPCHESHDPGVGVIVGHVALEQHPGKSLVEPV